jgi:hypothetical protein
VLDLVTICCFEDLQCTAPTSDVLDRIVLIDRNGDTGDDSSASGRICWGLDCFRLRTTV